MPANISLIGSLTGLSTIGGQLGPTQFSYALNDVTKFHTQELPVAAAAVALSVTVPAVGTQRLFYMKTTADVLVTINAEPQGTLYAGGILVRAGMVNVTTVTISGNGVTAAVVFIVAVGD